MADEQKQTDENSTQGGFRGTDTMESDKMRETGGQGGRGSVQDDDKKPLSSGQITPNDDREYNGQDGSPNGGTPAHNPKHNSDQE